MMKKLLVAVLVVVGVFNAIKPFPDGINLSGAEYRVPENAVRFYSDTTYGDEAGARFSEQEIFDEILRMIEGADRYILADMFLYNDFLGTATSSYRALSRELTDALVSKKERDDDIKIVFITDPINEIYGGYPSEYIARLRDAGIDVIVTNLDPLRDSNPLYSALWRTFARWFGNDSREGFLPNPFDSRGQKLGVRAYLALFNFKANHRKLIVADRSVSGGVELVSLVTSANPHDGSSAHTNTAIAVSGFVWRDVVRGEQAVADMSGGGDIGPPPDVVVRVEEREKMIAEDASVAVRVITEKRIRESVVERIDRLEEGDRFDMAMFYLSDRPVVRAMKRAANRGAAIRVLLDPNKDAFGRKKNGIPNRQVARELAESSENIEIRWCDTRGEQCHTKLLIFDYGDEVSLINGSANLTRRNIGGYNLETNILVRADSEAGVVRAARAYFDTVWNNEPGKKYSAAYGAYGEKNAVKTFLYYLMELSGMSSF